MEPILPVVDSAVGHSIAQYIGEREDREFLVTELERIFEENPTIAEFIVRWGNETGSMEAAYCGVIVYYLLRSQAEANRMNEELKLG